MSHKSAARLLRFCQSLNSGSYTSRRSQKSLSFAPQSSLSESGFALPIAVGLGLVMLLVSTTMVIRSQGDQVTASAQKETARSLSAAETGITRLKGFINTHRVLATFPDCVSRNTSTGACNDTGSTASWTNASNVPSLACKANNITGITTSKNITIEWQDISPTDSTQGQYRLVSYTYTPNSGVSANTAPGTGTLIVEGRVGQQGSNNTSTKTVGTATSRLQVTLPVIAGPSTDPQPSGLWATNFSFNNSNAKANANVLDSSCISGTSIPNANVGNLPGTSTRGNVTKQLVDFPSLPNNNVYAVPTTDPNLNVVACPVNSAQEFPRIGDKDSNGLIHGTNAPSNATYTYHIGCNGATSLRLTGNDEVKLGKTGQEKLNFYVDGNIDIAGNRGLVPFVDGANATQSIFYIKPSATVELAGTSGTHTATALQFYYYGTNQLTVKGTSNLSGFIFAPFATTRVVGTGDINGALWTKAYEAVGNGQINQTIFNLQNLAVSVPGNWNNQLGGDTSWQRLEAP